MNARNTLISSALLLASAAAPAHAQSAGSMTLGIGAVDVSPKSDNGKLASGTLPASVGSDVQPEVTFEYFVADNVGLEVLAATPFKHDISINGLGKVGSTKELPPTVSVQYHFVNRSKVTPFVGVGLNYTMFFSEDTRGALADSKLKLDDSFGAALHAGLDFALPKGALRVDARWIDIDTKVKLDGTKLGTVNVDPMTYSVAYVFKF